jgi:hypothetical protein
VKEQIFELIQRRDHVTFAERAQAIPGFRGDYMMEILPNVVLWAGLSAEAIDAIDELRVGKRIAVEPASVLTYLADGAALKFPVAKSLPKEGFKKPRWLPVCFRVSP